MQPTNVQNMPIVNHDFPLFLVRRLVEVGQGHFDEQLAYAVIGSCSLDFHEKVRVIDATLIEFQHDELISTFQHEADQFEALYLEHPKDVLKLVARQIFTAFMLGRHYGLVLSDKLEDAYARRMVRRVVRRGALPVIESVLTPEVCQTEPLMVWLWRHALPAGHPVWQSDLKRASEEV